MVGPFAENSIELEDRIKSDNIEYEEVSVMFHLRPFFTNVPEQGALETAKQLVPNYVSLKDITKSSAE